MRIIGGRKTWCEISLTIQPGRRQMGELIIIYIDLYVYFNNNKAVWIIKLRFCIILIKQRFVNNKQYC